ncbi:hypothetical protein SLA2020_427660 [Shorea laevis]
MGHVGRGVSQGPRREGVSAAKSGRALARLGRWTRVWWYRTAKSSRVTNGQTRNQRPDLAALCSKTKPLVTAKSG